jgi:uncharacterized RDD family membrane protein YckC
MNELPGSLAGPRKRLAGAAIDGILVVAVIVPIMLFTGGFREMAAGRAFSWRQELIWGGLAVAVWLVLNGRLLAEKGQTIGKRAVGTRIVDLQGGLPAVGKLFGLRYLLPWLIGGIPGLGRLFSLVDPLFVFGAERRCLHDYLAGTRVVNT